MFTFPARFERDDDGGFVVTFRDVPEAITQGDTLNEAREAAADALATALEFYIEDHRPVPAASAAEEGEELIALSLSVSAKVLLLNQMSAAGVRPVDLARTMGVRPQEVTRILNLRHATKIDTIDQAFRALGYRIELRISAV